MKTSIYIAVAVALCVAAINPAAAQRGSASAAPNPRNDDPRAKICGNGYIKLLTVSSVNKEGQYPWMVIHVDQTGFTGGGLKIITLKYQGGAGADSLIEWQAVQSAVQQAYLSRSPVRILSSVANSGCASETPRTFAMDICTAEIDCGGVTATASEARRKEEGPSPE